MRYLLALLFIFSASAQAINVNGPCPQTVGTLTVTVTQPRSSCISPCVIFFDATTSTDSANIPANGTVFQDVSFIWNFGDTLASGSGTWANGSNPNHNSTNLATGGIAAHMYQTAGRDTKYTATVTAFDGVNTVKCGIGATAFEPNASNGFPTTATVCYFNASVGSGCPAGATQTVSSVIVAGNMSNIRRLFKCGDTFTSAGVTVSGTKGTIGAYGSCVGTTTNRPIFQANAGTTTLMSIDSASGDIRITDIDFNGNNVAGAAIFDEFNINTNHAYQWTMVNLNARNHDFSYRWSAGAQMAIVNSNAGPQNGSPFINVYPNYAGVSGACPPCTSGYSFVGTVPNEDYMFMAGNFFNNGNQAYETVRDSYASKHIFSNNTIENGGSPTYAALKVHQSNTFNSNNAWIGAFSQYIIASDNAFLGTSGANLVEFTPENANTDERMRYMILERNLFAGTNVGGGRQVQVSGVSSTVRDNAFNNSLLTGSGGYSIQIAQRGVEPAPQFIEVYNNTCYSGGNFTCVGLTNSGNSGTIQPTNSIVQNNLVYLTNTATVNAGGGTNTLTNNTSNTALNPGFTNGSTNFSLISDFKPTANFSGALNGVPVPYDALGIAWSPTWDLGAVKH